MGAVFGRLKRGIDAFQQRRRWLAFTIAVWKKFGDDQAGSLAALIAYFAFVSIFPLLLLLITVLGVVLRDHPELQTKVLNSALTDFPIIGQQLRDNVRSLNRTGVGFVVGIIGTIFGARGVTIAIQNAMNTVWEVPRHDRPGFPFNLLRGFGLLGTLGIGVIATTVLSGFGTWGGKILGGLGGSVAAIAVSLVVNVGLFWLGLRLATSRVVRTRDLRNGAVLAAIVWQTLQTLGVYFVTHTLRHASSLYGTFGLVLGLLAWLYFQAQLTLYAVEADVVRVRRLWPRTIFPPPLTDQDRQAYAEYHAADRRLPETATAIAKEPANDPEALPDPEAGLDGGPEPRTSAKPEAKSGR
jgi:membrane protein